MTSPFTSLHIFFISVICIILQLDINVKLKLNKTALVAEYPQILMALKIFIRDIALKLALDKYAILVVYVPVDLWYNMTRYFRY